MFLYSLDYIIPALILYTFLAVVYLKGRSSSHKDLLINLLIALFGIPLSGYYGVMAINGYSDTSDGTVHEVLVLKKRYTRSKDGQHYYVTTESWRDNRPEEEIRVTSGFYQKAMPKTTVAVISTKPGRLGFEWLYSYGIGGGNWPR